MRIILFTLLVATWLLPTNGYGKSQVAHNVILMVADGMGLADVTAARIFKGGHNPAPLSFEKLPVIGYQRTYSADSVVTDSAAAASAFATGVKHLNGQISCGNNSPACSDPPPTILEIAKGLGKATGLVVTSTISHATPGAFGAHVSSRVCEGEISRQLLAETGVDLLLGGGIGKNPIGNTRTKIAPDVDILIGGSNNKADTFFSGNSDMEEAVTETQGQGPCQAYQDFTNEEAIDLAKANSYSVITTKEELPTTLRRSRKVLGVFGQGSKTPETFHVDRQKSYPSHEPTLAEMTQAALTNLSQDPDGFFLLVEGSQVDWRNHNNDQSGMIAEVLGFENAVAVVQKQLEEWLMDPKTRHQGTLLIVVSDHETGGFAITGPDGQPATKGMIVGSGWVTTHHTGTDTVVWSQGPGSSRLTQANNNTDIFRVMKESITPIITSPPGQTNR